MSFADATNAPPAIGRLMPRWSRAAMLVLILAVHVVALFKLSSTIPITPLPLPTIAIDFTQLPEAPAAPKAEADPAPAQPKAAPPEAETLPPPEDTPPPPDVPPRQAPAIEQAIPPSEPIPAPAPEPKPIEKVEQATPKPKPRTEPRRPVTARSSAARLAAPARAGAPASGPAQGAAMSSANYAALVASELKRHTFYPEAARGAGTVGAVGVAFMIGPSGRASSIAVTASSGNSSLDSAARQAVASIRVPPPPGGIFRTATTIRFNLR